MVQKIVISTEYITLGQFLKLAGVIDTGGQIKFFLQDTMIKVNDLEENRRGKKLYPGDTIYVEDIGTFQVDIES